MVPHSRGATVDLTYLFLRNSTQSSLRDWWIVMTPFPALKRRARIKSRCGGRKIDSSKTRKFKDSEKVTEP
jgi:hypothetical protein